MKWFKNLFLFLKQKKKVNRLQIDGLTLDSLRDIAKINEKYIEVKLPDGAYIRIWPYDDKVKEQEGKNNSFW